MYGFKSIINFNKISLKGFSANLSKKKKKLSILLVGLIVRRANLALKKYTESGPVSQWDDGKGKIKINS